MYLVYFDLTKFPKIFSKSDTKTSKCVLEKSQALWKKKLKPYEQKSKLFGFKTQRSATIHKHNGSLQPATMTVVKKACFNTTL